MESDLLLEVVARSKRKASVSKCKCNTPAKNRQKSNQNAKDSKPLTVRSKGKESLKKKKKKKKKNKKKQKKSPKTPKEPSSKKGGSLPNLEAKFINYVKSRFWMTDPGGYPRSLAVKEVS
ncbi:unnamed protein product [Nyctereutes procyonoides]|uniref:(raccoon dog) hypothetical protein n=1 Tax=Nyctereutes procyonoides TaxID=34880 RepID=A0A811Y0I4_NYCPR|nr:unnamed protein product [Nyctereutes procyonoides]